MELFAQQSWHTSSMVSEVSKAAVLSKRSPFLEQLRQKECNVQQELVQLQHEQQKTELELKAIEADKQRLDQQEAELDELERSDVERERETASVPLLTQQITDIEHQKVAISVILSKIDRAIAEGQSELEEAHEAVEQQHFERVRLQSNVEELRQKVLELETRGDELITKLQNEDDRESRKELISSKEKDIIALKYDIEKLQDDIVAKEAAAAKMEALVVTHEKELLHSAHCRQNHETRKARAEAKHATLQAAVAHRDERRKTLIGQRVKVRERRLAVEADQARLDELENDLKIQEEQLNDQKQRDEILARQATEEAERREQQRLEGKVQQAQEGRDKPERPSRVMNFLQKYSTDGSAVERKCERLALSAEHKRLALEHKQAQGLSFWENRMKELNDEMGTIIEKLEAKRQVSDVNGKLQELKTEHEEVLRHIANDQDELRQRISDESERSNGNGEYGRLAKEEARQLRRQLDERSLQQSMAVTELDRAQKELDAQKQNLEETLKTLHIKEMAAKLVLVACQQGLRSTESLYNQFLIRLSRVRPAK
jgi:hypothetical protein